MVAPHDGCVSNCSVAIAAGDVRARHENEFEACLLCPRDFMKALDGDDVSTIQSLREHRNELAHNLTKKLSIVDFGESQSLWDKVDRTIFKLSNHRAYVEIGADPEFRGIDWVVPREGNTCCSSELSQI